VKGKKEVRVACNGWAYQYCRLVVLERVIRECDVAIRCVIGMINDMHLMSLNFYWPKWMK
jgi:hypothetical protein